MVTRTRFLLGAVVGAFLLLMPMGVSLTAAHDIYVDGSAQGLNNGACWFDAYTDLQSALAVAVSGDTVRVAAGTYKPTFLTNPDDARTATFQLKPGVTVEGGYPAGGGDTRDPANKTILSGDIGVEGDGADNSYRVVTAVLWAFDADQNFINYPATLDGFTITGGRATDRDAGFTRGGGMYLEGGTPTLANITFSDNQALDSGGGLATTMGATATLTRVTFSENSASQGGGMYSDDYPTLTNVTFSGNSAFGTGGGAYFRGGHPTLTNVTFTGNAAGWGFGAIAGEKDVDLNPYVLRNVILWGNSPAGLLRRVTIENSVVEGGCPADYSGDFTCTNIITDDPKLDPQGLRDNGGYTQTVALLAGSSAIDAGADYSLDGVTTDQRGVARPQGAGYDIGAYEYVDVTPPVLTVPDDVTVEATSSSGTPVDIGLATATDNIDPNPVVTNNAPMAFLLGLTTVTWRATDASGNSATAIQKVTVVDTTPPILTVPADVTVTQTSPNGTPVNIGLATAIDIGDASPVITNNAPALFPVGITTVTWTATDHSGNAATATQNVTVVATTPSSTPGVHVHGQGTIVVNGARATFEFNVRVKKTGQAVGTFSFDERRIRLDLDSKSITSVVVTGTHARIVGTTRIGARGRYTFIADVDDIRDPGRRIDKFAIQVSNGIIIAPTVLQRGNIDIDLKGGDDRD